MSFTSALDPQPSRWADVYAASAARAVSNCGDLLAATALALVLADHGAGGWAVSALLLAAAVPPVVLAPVVGRIADRLDSRKILIVTGIAQVAICVALAYVQTPALIVALVAVLAAGLALTGPTLAALIPLMVGRSELPRATGISQTASTIGMLAAPALGGFLVGRFGSSVPLLIDAASYLALPIAALVIKTRRSGADAGPGTAGSVGRAHYRLRSDQLLWPLGVMIIASVAALSAVNVIDVFFVRQTLHGSATMYGLIGACWMIGMVIGAMVWTRFTHHDVTTVIWLAVLMLASGVILGAVAMVPAVGWMVPLNMAGGICNGGINVSAGVLLGRRVPDQVRGRVGATFNSLVSGANAVGYLAGGALLAVWAPRVLLMLAGVGAVLAVIVFGAPLALAISRERRSAPDTVPETAADPVSTVAAEPAAEPAALA